MDEALWTRRRMLATGAGALTAACFAASPAAADEAGGGVPAFTAAVMRTPVHAPPSLDALAAVRARNAAAMVDAIEGLMRGPGPRPRLIVFPVLPLVSSRRSASGVPMAAVAVDLTADPRDLGPFAPVVAACRRHDCYVATSTQEKTARLPGRYFHTGFVMGPQGLVLRSPKSQAKSAPEVSYLRDMAAEYTRAFGPQSILPVARTPLGVLGCYIEAEAEVFEASRLLASKGAQIIVHPSAEDDVTPWPALKQAIAFENQVFLLTGTASRTITATDPDGGWGGGASTIVGPDGAVLARLGGRDEGAATAVIDLSAIEAAKRRSAGRTTPAWGLYRDFYGRAAE